MKQIQYSNQEEKFLEQVDRLIEEQEKMLALVHKAVENCPEGSLKIQKKGAGRYYYKRFVGENGKEMLQYLPKKNLKTIRELAHKKYFAKALPVLSKNVSALKKMRHTYQYNAINEISGQLQEMIKHRLSKKQILYYISGRQNHLKQIKDILNHCVLKLIMVKESDPNRN